MKIKFNKTGTHIHNGKLKIRLDFYPGSNNKTFAKQNIDVFARKLTEAENEKIEVKEGTFVLTKAAKELRKSVPTKKQLNPCLLLFVSVDSNLTKQEVKDFIKLNFRKKDTDDLDDVLDRGNRSDLLDAVKDKTGKKYDKSFTEKDVQKLNTELSGLAVDNNGSN